MANKRITTKQETDILEEIEKLNAKGTKFASKKAEKWLDLLKSCEVIETSKNSTKIEIGTKFYMLISYPGKEKENDELVKSIFLEVLTPGIEDATTCTSLIGQVIKGLNEDCVFTFNPPTGGVAYVIVYNIGKIQEKEKIKVKTK